MLAIGMNLHSNGVKSSDLAYSFQSEEQEAILAEVREHAKLERFAGKEIRPAARHQEVSDACKMADDCKSSLDKSVQHILTCHDQYAKSSRPIRGLLPDFVRSQQKRSCLGERAESRIESRCPKCVTWMESETSGKRKI